MLSVWSAPEKNPWASVVVRMMVERGKMEPPSPGAPGVFGMASEERTRDLLESAGFEHVAVSELPLHFSYRGIADYMTWATNTAGALAIVLRTLSEEERHDVEEKVWETFEPFVVDGGSEVPGVVLNAVAS